MPLLIFLQCEEKGFDCLRQIVQPGKEVKKKRKTEYPSIPQPGILYFFSSKEMLLSLTAPAGPTGVAEPTSTQVGGPQSSIETSNTFLVCKLY